MSVTLEAGPCRELQPEELADWRRRLRRYAERTGWEPREDVLNDDAAMTAILTQGLTVGDFVMRARCAVCGELVFAWPPARASLSLDRRTARWMLGQLRERLRCPHTAELERYYGMHVDEGG
jgi:hypothetical protein